MNTLTDNLILNTDSYKVSHYKFLNPQTEYIQSYIEARTGGLYDEVVFFGLQYFLKKFMDQPITMTMIDQAEKILKAHLPDVPFNREGWEYIVNEHGGRLPLAIRAVPEGTVVPEGQALVTVVNTDPKVPWLGAYFETALLRAVWYGTTVATRSYKIRKLIHQYMAETGDPEMTPYKFVDFGARGATTREAAEVGGAAHLANFMVTDNIVGILASMEYYESEDVTGVSIAASEHSVVLQEGPENEKAFFQRALNTFGGNGKMVSLVSDTYSFENALDMWCNDLRQEVLENGAQVVIRPDSGDPTEMVMMALNRLSEAYGGHKNGKGYFVLNPAVRIIQGDGVNLEKVREILETMKQAGYSADNVTFGCGGFLLQDLTRDTQRFAQKACSVLYDGDREWRAVRKTVETNPTKSSKGGHLDLIKRNGEFQTIDVSDFDPETDVSYMQLVYAGGRLTSYDTFDNIRERINSNF